jgi:hypothetical protein
MQINAVLAACLIAITLASAIHHDREIGHDEFGPFTFTEVKELKFPAQDLDIDDMYTPPPGKLKAFTLYALILHVQRPTPSL